MKTRWASHYVKPEFCFEQGNQYKGENKLFQNISKIRLLRSGFGFSRCSVVGKLGNIVWFTARNLKHQGNTLTNYAIPE